MNGINEITEKDKLIIRAIINEVIDNINFVDRHFCDQRYQNHCRRIDDLSNKLDKIYFALISLTFSIIGAVIAIFTSFGK